MNSPASLAGFVQNFDLLSSLDRAETFLKSIPLSEHTDAHHLLQAEIHMWAGDVQSLSSLHSAFSSSSDMAKFTHSLLVALSTCSSTTNASSDAMDSRAMTFSTCKAFLDASSSVAVFLSQTFSMDDLVNVMLVKGLALCLDALLRVPTADEALEAATYISSKLSSRAWMHPLLRRKAMLVLSELYLLYKPSATAEAHTLALLVHVAATKSSTLFPPHWASAADRLMQVAASTLDSSFIPSDSSCCPTCTLHTVSIMHALQMHDIAAVRASVQTCLSSCGFEKGYPDLWLLSVLAHMAMRQYVPGARMARAASYEFTDARITFLRAACEKLCGNNRVASQVLKGLVDSLVPMEGTIADSRVPVSNGPVAPGASTLIVPAHATSSSTAAVPATPSTGILPSTSHVYLPSSQPSLLLLRLMVPLLCECEMFEDASRVALTLVDRFPTSAEAYYAVGCVEDHSENRDVAVVLYRKALALDPMHVAANAALATVYLQQGMITMAKFHAVNVVKRAPREARGWMLVARCLQARHRMREAARCFSVAVRLNDGDVPLQDYGLLFAVVPAGILPAQR
jgi:tetratricopeptide (TPR) repeat protein